MTLEDLVGNHILSGVEFGTKKVNGYGWYEDANFAKFTIDGVTYLALENPDDGYRSYMEELQIVEETCSVRLPDVKVRCLMRDSKFHGQIDDVLSFVDVENGKEFLAIGTENTNDYYPYCVFEYTPENMSCNSEVATDD